MKCKLHNGEAELCISHIIPKFVYKWMKETGPGRLRQMKDFKRPVQDGIKGKMLCLECERKFNIYETWFKKNVFDKYLKQNIFEFTSTKELGYFIISILWRVLVIFKDDGNNYFFKSNLDKAEIEWKNYLNKNLAIQNYKNFHLILIDNSYFVSEKSDLYFSRSVDIDIVQSNSLCFIYAKFSRFIIIGEIIGCEELSFKNTQVEIGEKLNNKNQIFEGLGDFFKSRVSSTITFKELGKNQQEKNILFYKDKLKNISELDYFKIIKKYN
ncbi:MAG: hypothetical protein ACK5IC_08705 [Moheibacter sp.]